MITIFEPLRMCGTKFFADADTSLAEWECIGIGTPPDSGRPYVVGKRFDSANNRTMIDTFSLHKVAFIGKI